MGEERRARGLVLAPAVAGLLSSSQPASSAVASQDASTSMERCGRSRLRQPPLAAHGAGRGDPGQYVDVGPDGQVVLTNLGAAPVTFTLDGTTITLGAGAAGHVHVPCPIAEPGT